MKGSGSSRPASSPRRRDVLPLRSHLSPTLVFGAAPIAAFGPSRSRSDGYPGVASRERRFWRPSTRSARRPIACHGASQTVTGGVSPARRPASWLECSPTRSSCRPGSPEVRRRDHPQAVSLFVVPCDAQGVSRIEQIPTTGHPEAEIQFDNVHVGADDLLHWNAASAGDAGARFDDGGRTLLWLLEHAATALCVQEAGACKAAVEITARYTSERRQFGKPVAEFQAVGQRAADAYVDAEGVRLTAWQAAWRLDAGLPASAEVAVAKFWADDGAQRSRPRLSALARWSGRRPRLPGAPLLPHDQAPLAHPRWNGGQPAAARGHPGVRRQVSFGLTPKLRRAQGRGPDWRGVGVALCPFTGVSQKTADDRLSQSVPSSSMQAKRSRDSGWPRKGCRRIRPTRSCTTSCCSTASHG